jgi:hypothetical protein
MSLVQLAIEANNLVVRLFRVRRQSGADYERVSRIIERANKRAHKRHERALKANT